MKPELVHTNRGFRLSHFRWGVAAICAILVVSIAGGGGWGARAAAPAQGGTNSVRDGGRANGNETPDPSQYFEDVPSDNPFFDFVNRLFLDGIAIGYPCGDPDPCVPPGNRPYYHPGANVTRAQMAKFVENARNLPGYNINANNTGLITPFQVAANAPRAVSISGVNNGSGPTRDTANINAGLYGYANGPSNSLGLLALAANDNGAWIASTSSNFYGLYVQQNGARIEVNNSNIANALYVNGHITVVGGCTGCTLDEVMLNTGTADLHPGDVVALGAAAPEGAKYGDTPVAGVEEASEAYSTGVVGVVSARYLQGDNSAPAGSVLQSGGMDPKAASIKPGEYMTVVTQGTYKMVKVDAGKGAIHIGDLLTTSSTAGAAMKVSLSDKTQAFGAVIGKAMGNLDSGTGYIPVLITLK